MFQFQHVSGRSNREVPSATAGTSAPTLRNLSLTCKEKPLKEEVNQDCGSNQQTSVLYSVPFQQHLFQLIYEYPPEV